MSHGGIRTGVPAAAGVVSLTTELLRRASIYLAAAVGLLSRHLAAAGAPAAAASGPALPPLGRPWARRARWASRATGPARHY